VNHPDVFSQKSRLDAVFELVAGLEPGDPRQVHLTQYLCIRVAGFVEQSMRHLYYEHARRRSEPTVAQFVSRRLDRPGNLNAEALCQLAGQFSDTWARELREFLGEERKLAVDSVLNNRNRIAHGESTSLGLVQLRDWYGKIVEVVERIDQLTL
jgi:hypothetical protein